MTVQLTIPNQEDKKCELCGTRSEKSLIHQLQMAGSNKVLSLLLCDECVCDLKDAVKDY